jgi:hypothetical protein
MLSVFEKAETFDKCLPIIYYLGYEVDVSTMVKEVIIEKWATLDQ